jgi:hypothetical protein
MGSVASSSTRGSSGTARLSHAVRPNVCRARGGAVFPVAAVRRRHGTSNRVVRRGAAASAERPPVPQMENARVGIPSSEVGLALAPGASLSACQARVCSRA